MMPQTHFDTAAIIAVINKTITFFPLKCVVSAVVSFMCWAFACNFLILGSVFILVVIDLITGVAKSMKNEHPSSRGFFRSAIKLCVYFMMILTAKLVDKHLPYPFASSIMNSFLVVTEGISILENIYLLGYPVPTVLVKKLKVFIDKGKKDE